jgi:tRNA (mo5U34)-methyltransferase
MYAELQQCMPGEPWLDAVSRLARERLQRHSHGDLPRWRAALQSLPQLAQRAALQQAAPELGATADDEEQLRETLMCLHPWRKGPLRLGGVFIDTEWRSDWKWARIAPHVELAGCSVLDVGCGNGYYGLRMLGEGARFVVGIDPTLLYVMQWLACRHFSGPLPNFVLPLALEDLPDGAPVAGFDAVFSMGVLYHRRDPQHHLERLRTLLRPGGTLVLETLVLPTDRDGDLLQPGGRYARMPNVHAIPGVTLLQCWLRDAGFGSARLLDRTATSLREQRSTPWMPFESLQEALDPADRARTVEGHPAPVRAVLLAGARRRARQ